MAGLDLREKSKRSGVNGTHRKSINYGQRKEEKKKKRPHVACVPTAVAPESAQGVSIPCKIVDHGMPLEEQYHDRKFKTTYPQSLLLLCCEMWLPSQLFSSQLITSWKSGLKYERDNCLAFAILPTPSSLPRM